MKIRRKELRRIHITTNSFESVFVANGETCCEIPHRLERGTKHSLQGCGNLSLANAF